MKPVIAAVIAGLLLGGCQWYNVHHNNDGVCIEGTYNPNTGWCLVSDYPTVTPTTVGYPTVGG